MTGDTSGGSTQGPLVEKPALPAARLDEAAAAGAAEEEEEDDEAAAAAGAGVRESVNTSIGLRMLPIQSAAPSGENMPRKRVTQRPV